MEKERRGTKKKKERKVNQYFGTKGADLKWTQAVPPPHLFCRGRRLTLCGRLRQERMHQIMRIDFEN